MPTTTSSPAALPAGWAKGGARRALEEWILATDYPCLGARSVFRGRRATVRLYAELGSAAAAPDLVNDLTDFAAALDPDAGFTSFLAAFTGPGPLDERRFERLLWRQLRLITRADGSDWDAAVSDDPLDDRFGLSVSGTAFFVVGLHPGASRMARRAPMPVLVFNLHSQFEALRADDKYAAFRDAIRRRDLRLQGSLNPMLSDHGAVTEARQYSGRQLGKNWRAPFWQKCPHADT